MDYDSVVNTIAASGTVIALVFGIRAYSVAKRQGRVTFELEVIRELNGLLDRINADRLDDRMIKVHRISAGLKVGMLGGGLTHWSAFCFDPYYAVSLADEQLDQLHQELLEAIRRRME